MKIAISGSNGYIGKNLIDEFRKSNHEIIRIERSKLYDIEHLSGIISGASVVINLAGSSILRRWTEAAKIEISRSRIDTTRNIVKAINGLPDETRPAVFISASAVGIYATDSLHTEESTALAYDFIGEVVKTWEKTSLQLNPSVRRVVFRLGLVLGKESKTVRKLLPSIKIGLGGKIGTGKQPFPFIHIEDVVRAVIWSIENGNTQGTYNLVAPENIDNNTFIKTLAKALKRPAIFTVPALVLKLVLGQASSILLDSPQVVPERLQKERFKFSFPDINSCVAEIIK